MSTSFGEQLKAAREAQGITLREVAEQTRIALRYLEAIEANDFKVLPGGVFNRSFIKTYAKYIGFDETEAIRLYQEASHAPTPEEETQLSLPRHKVYTDDSVQRSPLTNLLLVGGVLLLLAAGMYGFLRWYQQPSPTVAAKPTPTPTPVAVPTPAAVAATPAPSGSPSGSPVASGSPDATPFTSAPPPTPPPSGSFAIQIRAKDKAVQVAAGLDGNKLETIVLKPGESRDLAPQNALAVEYTEPGGELMEIYVNGQPIAMPLQGKQIGKFKIISFVLSRDSYQSMLQGAAPVAATPTPQ
jgi:cytoskeleton protein RodZ